MNVRTGVRAGHTQFIDPEGRATVIDPGRYWEIDSLRGLAMGEMLAVHLIRSWVKALSPSLALVMLKLWQGQKALVEGIIFAMLFSGALLLSSGVTMNREGEQRSVLSTVLPSSLWGAIALILPALIFWLATSGSGAAGFLALSGISMSIDYARRKEDYREGELFKRYLKRGGSLFAWGMSITVLSLLLTPGTPILFGILQLLGLSSILAIPFLKAPGWVSLTGGLLWLAREKVPGPPLDYHTLLPWFGVVLLGVWLGKTLYRDGKRVYRLPDLSEKRWAEGLSWLGKNSLTVYLAQEPVFLLGSALAA
jgi:uncharacterized membrane protein